MLKICLYLDVCFYSGMQAEREYQQKLKNCLDNPEYEKMHPMRRAMQQRSLQNA